VNEVRSKLIAFIADPSNSPAAYLGACLSAALLEYEDHPEMLSVMEQIDKEIMRIFRSEKERIEAAQREVSDGQAQ